jgi:Lrp/AsnC family leucine-responsive transcriptional regulator
MPPHLRRGLLPALKVHVPAIDALAGVLDQFLQYGQTTSSFVVTTPVPARNPSA